MRTISIHQVDEQFWERRTFFPFKLFIKKAWRWPESAQVSRSKGGIVLILGVHRCLSLNILSFSHQWPPPRRRYRLREGGGGFFNVLAGVLWPSARVRALYLQGTKPSLMKPKSTARGIESSPRYYPGLKVYILVGVAKKWRSLWCLHPPCEAAEISSLSWNAPVSMAIGSVTAAVSGRWANTEEP